MSQTVLITGGTGTLGRALRRRLAEQDVRIRVMSRRMPRPGEAGGEEWMVARLTTGEGVREAVQGADVVVHAASSPSPAAVELEGGRYMLEAARAEGVAHFLYISIIGVDRISFAYYANKLKVEHMVAESTVPYSILRAAQFHAFIDQIFQGLARLPIILQPRGWRFQPVSAAAVADVLAEAVRAGPQGRMSDLAGPEVLGMDEMLKAWMEAQGLHRPVLRVPIPGALSRGFRAGHNTAPDGTARGESWAEYLARRFDDPGAADP